MAASENGSAASGRDAGQEITGEAADRICRAVIELLETEGYETMLLRDVARHARVSLTKIYKLYGSREELILAALDWWLEQERYAALEVRVPEPDEILYARLMRVLRAIFEPWEQHPALLTAYFRARSAPGGEQLMQRGLDAVVPPAMAALDGVDPEFVQDLNTIVSSLVYGLLGRFAGGEIEVGEIVPAIDRTVYWLTTGYDAVREHRVEPGR
ncbi:TetR family transcriptional regulator [Nocardia macrotermitis]|uniref:TetR family transcriptional regulator n=1 Tax=Nocardia macrotermitis TaxID=2585198 RepID=UPI0029E7F111|nr:TetR family transcriptional regulator [Nocardia macrotermitis]